MKRIFLAGLMSVSILCLNAQDAKTVRKSIDSKEWDKAKTQVDAFISKSPTNAEAHYLKAKVYGAMAASDQFRSQVPEGRMAAFESFKKSLELGGTDKEFILMQAKEAQTFYKPLFDLYTGYFDEGAKYFSTGAEKTSKADFEMAMNSFKNANMVGKYIHSNKWALSEIDTSLVLNIAKAALNAEKKDEAVIYLKILADNRIKGTQDGNQGYEMPYQWLTYHFKEKGDEAEMLKYAKLGQEFFPKDDYYDAVMLEYYRKKGDKAVLFQKYADAAKRFPDSLSYHFNYANDAFNYVYNSDEGVVIKNKPELLKTINDELGVALKLSPNDVNTNWLYGQYFYNEGVDLKERSNKTKGTKPEDVKMKAELNMQSTAAFNKAIPFVEKAMGIMENGYKKSDKSRYKSVSDLGQRIYTNMNQKDKVKIYQDKYDTAETKFVK